MSAGSTMLIHGSKIELDENGFLIDMDDWSEEYAIFLSRMDGILLSADHWEVIRIVRAHYMQFTIAPMPKIIVKKLNQKLHTARYSVKYLYQLFPRRPFRLACKYAGIPQPTGCT